jgi:nitrate/TMAO reductase-like tetraheme cytochrome c subunit
LNNKPMKLPESYYNPLTMVGSILAGISAIIIVFSMIAHALFGTGGSYAGIVVYIVLPVFLIIGLILIPIGMSRRSRKIRREGEKGKGKWIVIDLRDHKQWNAMAIFMVSTIAFLILTGIGSYQAFHYTESNEFCGTLCHEVMDPEFTAYQESPHARVACVECHVGSGAEWYVKSKLTGLYQVYSVLFNKYSRPIETPIHSLRPARETCEECHWPEKFYSYRLRNIRNFLADSANTEWDIQLKLKIGSELKSEGLLEGIHWHINQDVQIEYIASDTKREYLPWVRYINRATGDTIVYEDMYDSLDPEAMDTLEMRVMDCLDCHNRPSHQYLPPQDFVDGMIASGKISAELPEVKSMAMQLFNQQFPTRDSGNILIREGVKEFYELNYPGVAEEKAGLIEQATDALLAGFAQNFFPYMNVNWDAYPNHIGHLEFNGCFRCHNGNHQSKNGEVISRDCNLCHDLLGQGSKENYMAAYINDSMEFVHPVDIAGAWKEMSCSDCHRYLY